MRRAPFAGRIARAAGLAPLLLAAGVSLTGALMPRYGDTLLVAARGPVRTLDPAQATTVAERDLVANLFETLVAEGPDGPRPGTAVSWSVTPDSLAWTFRLRQGPRFTNGRPVTATDYVDSWRRLRDLGGAGGLLDGIAAAADGADALVLTLEKPAAGLLRRLSDPATAAVQVVTGPRGESLVGSGPFRYAGMKGSAFVLAARREHWAGRPFAAQVSLLPAATDREAREAWDRGFHVVHGFAGIGGAGECAVADRLQEDPLRRGSGVLDLARTWLLK